MTAPAGGDPGHGRVRRAARGSMAMLAGNALSFVVSAAVVPLTAGSLGAERFGLLMAALAAVALCEPLDLGVGSAVVTLLARRQGARSDPGLDGAPAGRGAGPGDDGTVRGDDAELVAAALRATLVVAAVLALGAVLAGPRLGWPGLLGVTSPEVARLVGPTLAVAVAAVIVGLPLSLVDRVHLALQAGDRVGATAFAGAAISLVALLVATATHADVPVLAAAALVGPVVARLGAGVVLVRRWRPDLWRPRGPVARPLWRELRGGAALFLGLQLAVAVAFTSDQFVVARVLGAGALPAYAIPARLFGLVSAASFVLLRPLWPAYAEAAASGDHGWVRRAVRRSVVATAAVTAALVGPMLLLGPWLVRTFGRDAIAYSRSTFAAFAVWTVLSSVGAAVAMVLNGLGVVRMQLVASAAMAVTNLALSIVLARRVGVAGVLWGSVVAYTACIVVPYSYLLPRLLRARSVEATAGGAARRPTATCAETRSEEAPRAVRPVAEVAR